jgi:OOP family OmpA-OmpF porin
MKFAKASGTLGLAALAAIASPLAAADDPAGVYVGANIGQSRATIDNARITSSLLGGGFSTTSITDDDRDTGFKIFGGYQFNRNFALEGGYFDLGKFGFMANTVPAGTLSGSMRLRGVNLDLVGMLPITGKFSAFGRVGMNYAEARDSFTGTGFVNVLTPSPGKRDTNLKYGLGVQYNFTPALGMRLEGERYRVNDAVGNRGDIDLLSVGLVFTFGVKAPKLAPAPRAAAPEPVYEAPRQVAVIAPPPPVVVAPQPRPPVPTMVSFFTDSLFDFDRAALKPEGKQHLDRFAADLRGANFEVISVTGHTDRLGPPEYNMELSTRRAGTVEAYLTESGGIPEMKIAARGAGESEPVTKPGECKGETATRTLINCLQPDRRVEVEVSGTR